jgi:DNA primase large subunit
LENTVGVNIEGDLNLRLTTRHRGNARKLELSEQVVVASHTTLTFINLNEDSRLVISECGENLVLLGGDGSVARNENSHDTTSSLETKGERSNIEQEDIVKLLVLDTSEDGSLDGSTISNSLIRVDRLVELLTIEEVLEELLDLGDTGRTTDEDDLVNLSLIELRVSQDLLDWLEARAEEINVELLELGTSDGGVKILSLIERVNLDGGLS